MNQHTTYVLQLQTEHYENGLLLWLLKFRKSSFGQFQSIQAMLLHTLAIAIVTQKQLSVSENQSAVNCKAI